MPSSGMWRCVHPRRWHYSVKTSNLYNCVWVISIIYNGHTLELGKLRTQEHNVKSTRKVRAYMHEYDVMQRDHENNDV
jgi:hypothetical protein